MNDQYIYISPTHISDIDTKTIKGLTENLCIEYTTCGLKLSYNSTCGGIYKIILYSDNTIYEYYIIITEQPYEVEFIEKFLPSNLNYK